MSPLGIDDLCMKEMFMKFAIDKETLVAKIVGHMSSLQIRAIYNMFYAYVHVALENRM